MRNRRLQIGSALAARIVYVLLILLALAALVLVILCKGWVRMLGIGGLLMAVLSLWLFLSQIQPKMIQHDLAVNTLLTSSARAETEEDEPIPPLNLLMDEVILEVQQSYQRALSQNQNSLAVLQSQINPHFLYNTLDCIRGEALEAEMDDIASMVESLSSFFRYSISSGDILVQLRDELRNIQIYYQIQRYRFRDRFRLEVECEDERALDCYLPKLTLQPIMENCILHGLELKEADGLIRIHVTLTDRRLILTVSDNGCGMSPNDLERLREKINSPVSPESERGMVRHGIAVRNINKQLKLLFGPAYGLSVSSRLGEGTEVEIQIPAVDQRRALRYSEAGI